MEKRKFDKLDVEASLLGFGCMRFPLNQDGHIEEIEAEKMIDLAIESGTTYIDTAYPYHDGDSEPFVGRVLKKYPRESFKLATKLPIWNINSQQEAMEIFDSQLKRLDVEYVDFYLLHALDADKWKKVKEYHIIEMCEELRQQGKIKYLATLFKSSLIDNCCGHIFSQAPHSLQWLAFASSDIFVYCSLNLSLSS